MKAIATPALVLGAAAVALAASACGSAGQECVPGARIVNGVAMHVFCGPAKATVTVRIAGRGPKTYDFSNGQCRRSATHLAVHIGTLVLSRRVMRRRSYFGLLLGAPPGLEPEGPIPRRDGTYRGGLITMNEAPATSYSVSGEDLRITLSHGRNSGSFAGTRPASPVLKTPRLTLTGSFAC